VKAGIMRTAALALRKLKHLPITSSGKLSKPDGHRALYLFVVIAILVLILIALPVNVTMTGEGFLSMGISRVGAAVDYEYLKPTVCTDASSKWNNDANAYDLTYNDQTTRADSVAGSADIDPWVTFNTWQTKTQTYTATVLYVNWKTNAGYSNDQFAIRYTKDGTNYLDLVAMAVYNDASIVTSSVALDANQNLALVKVKLVYDRVTGADAGITYVYDIWTKGTYTVLNPAITNSPSEFDFGLVEVNTATNTTINYFTLTNSGDCQIDVTIQGTDMAGGGFTWTLSDTATQGNMICGFKAGLDDADDNFDIVVRKTATYNYLVENLGVSATQGWGLQLLSPTVYNDGNTKAGTITVTAAVG
jgi:hypothetical protein